MGHSMDETSSAADVAVNATAACDQSTDTYTLRRTIAPRDQCDGAMLFSVFEKWLNHLERIRRDKCIVGGNRIQFKGREDIWGSGIFRVGPGFAFDVELECSGHSSVVTKECTDGVSIAYTVTPRDPHRQPCVAQQKYIQEQETVGIKLADAEIKGEKCKDCSKEHHLGRFIRYQILYVEGDPTKPSAIKEVVGLGPDYEPCIESWKQSLGRLPPRG